MAENVRVRVAVVVNERSEWTAFGQHNWGRDETLGTCEEVLDTGLGGAIYWLTAELPVPAEPEIAAEVSSDVD